MSRMADKQKDKHYTHNHSPGTLKQGLGLYTTPGRQKSVDDRNHSVEMK